ncbi:HK97 family phage prohead protease [Sphingobium sp. WTD-1]|uniref:HK97 family phage prohead protease n=1 Tax=Sphingobium sp. WTD-1 TaxID=2979467 RepID=UPI0024DE3836|nr:HK97 family phage prohead protease [Sphingobium sp. WTD-1]WIA55190.1 HK97 family phage prohead protease [Sphingobium sp. WTD-1]
MTNDIRFKEFRIDSFDAEKGIVEGYASKFGNVDQVGDVVEKGAFTKSIQQGASRVRFLWQHNKQEPIGVIQEIREDDHGLYIKAEFANTQRAQETRELMKMGALDSFSIGYRVPKDKIVVEQTKEGQIQRLKEIHLFEVSVVTFPCNVEARLTGIKSSLEGRFADLPLEQQKSVSDYIEFLVAKQMDDAANDDDIAVVEPEAEPELSLNEPESEAAKAAAEAVQSELDRLFAILRK